MAENSKIERLRKENDELTEASAMLERTIGNLQRTSHEPTSVRASNEQLAQALRNLRDVAHREVSPRYSAALDEAFTLADIALGEFDSEGEVSREADVGPGGGVRATHATGSAPSKPGAAEPPSGWRPIETAPQGDAIVWLPDKGAVMARLCGDLWYDLTTGWLCEPTLWAPMPAGPSETKNSVETAPEGRGVRDNPPPHALGSSEGADTHSRLSEPDAANVAKPHDDPTAHRVADLRAQSQPTNEPPAVDVAPIAKLTVRDGLVQRAGLYAPGLPDGDHDVFPVPLSPKGELRPHVLAELPTSRLLLVPCPRCFGTGKLKPYKREGDTDWRIDDCPEKHVTAQPPTSAQSSGHEPYWTRSFWSPCREYLLSVHSYGEREIVAIDDNGDEWEATGPAQDIAGDAVSLLRQSSTKEESYGS